MRINRKRRNRSEMIERIELSKEMTRFRRDDQYFVTLKMRKSLRALKTDRPKEPACATMLVQHTSKTLAKMTIQSNRLNDDSK